MVKVALKIYISTNGCVEGQLSSTIVKQFFVKNRLTVINNLAEADLAIFYACGLTQSTENDSMMRIKKLKKLIKPSAKLIVWGCLPKINPHLLRTIYNGPIIGPMDTSFFEGLLQKPLVRFDDIQQAFALKMLNPICTSETITYDYISSRASWISGYNLLDSLTDLILLIKRDWSRLLGRAHKENLMFIPVSRGCTGNCTYCSERCVFGTIKSRPIETILREFKWGLQQGYNVFSLIATDIGAYGLDIGCTVSDLLEKMVRVDAKRSYKIILNQLNAFHLKKFFSDLEPIFASGKIKSLCCPVQSGSNRILKLMGRMYTVEEWREHMIKIRTKFPHIELGTQLMVGFPSETEEDFKATVRLLDYPLALDFIYVFRYSGRPNVPSVRINGQVSEKVKELRYKQLLRKHAQMYIFSVLNRSMMHFLKIAR